MEHRFIGRNRELEQLRQLWNGNQHKIFGLYGHKSVGKTRLLKKFISELKEKNQDLKVLEFDFHEIKTYKRFLKLFSKSFQIEWDQNDSEKDENEITDDIYELVDKVLEEIKKNYSESKACVFVLNNLENAMPKANRDGTDPDVLDKSLWDNIWEDIFKKLIPNSYLYIDSTRHAKFARYGNAAELIDVEPLEDDDALELLREVAGDSVMSDGNDVATAIANLCFGLPMAVINAGQQLREMYSPEEMVYLLTEKTIEIVSDEFLESDHRIARSLHTSLSRLGDTDRKNLVSLAFAIGEKEQHNLDPEMEIEKLAKLYGFETVAEFKMNFVSKYRYNGMIKFMRATQTISCHPILQKYLLVGKAVENLREEFKDKVKDILLKQVVDLHKDSLDKRKTEECHRQKKNSDDEAIVAHPTEEVNKCISKDQNKIVQDNTSLQQNECIVTQPVEEPEKSNPNNLEFFKKQINRLQTCLPAYPKSDKKSLEGTVFVAQPVDEDDKRGNFVEGFFQNSINSPATCLPAIPKDPNSDVRKPNDSGMAIGMKERYNEVEYKGKSQGNDNVKLNASNADIRKNLKGILKPKYLHSKSLSESDIQVNGKNNNYFQNDLSKSENQMNIIADIKSLEENDKFPSSDNYHGNHRVATVYPYHKSCDTVRGPDCKNQNSDFKTNNNDSKTAEETEEKTIWKSVADKKKPSSSQEDKYLHNENVRENFYKPPHDNEPLDIAGPGLDPNSLSSDTSSLTENANPTEQPLHPHTTEEPSGSNSSHAMAATKEVFNWIFKPFFKSQKRNGNIEDI